jgi:DNA (cytosine-5)-methyltransferase 1
MRSVEIFAGCGGLALGIAEAGFRHALVLERDPFATSTLLANQRRRVRHIVDWPIRQLDVREVSFARYAADIALVSGGPPCQPFSIGGKHQGPADPRNMWPEAIRVVRELRPKAFLFENVRGLLRPAFSRYLEFIQLQLSWPSSQRTRSESWQQTLARLRSRQKAGRRPAYRVLISGINAADYGAPQKRHRAVVLGVRADIVDEVSFPGPSHSRESLLWSQWITGEYWDRHRVPRNGRPELLASDLAIVERLRASRRKPEELPWVTVRDAIGDLPAPRSDLEPIASHRLHPGARIYPRHTGSGWDQPAKALKAGSHGVPGGENILAPGDGTVRYFTLREMARLQGFPDSYRIATGWKAPVMQLGNAVPVPVGKAFGRAIAELIESVDGHPNCKKR